MVGFIILARVNLYIFQTVCLRELFRKFSNKRNKYDMYDRRQHI